MSVYEYMYESVCMSEYTVTRAYLSHHALVDVVITEDSDALPFGVRDVLFKWSKEGHAQRMCLSEALTAAHFSLSQLQCMCVLR